MPFWLQLVLIILSLLLSSMGLTLCISIIRIYRDRGYWPGVLFGSLFGLTFIMGIVGAILLLMPKT